MTDNSYSRSERCIHSLRQWHVEELNHPLGKSNPELWYRVKEVLKRDQDGTGNPESELIALTNEIRGVTGASRQRETSAKAGAPAKRQGRRRKGETDGETKVVAALQALLRERSQHDPPSGKDIIEASGVANVSRFIMKLFGSQTKFEQEWQRDKVRLILAKRDYSSERHAEYDDNRVYKSKSND